MTGYIEGAYCKGRCPDGVVPLRRFSRPDLITKLLGERDVARFIVAPDGYGKSSLIAEYCDMVQNFEHTFWLNGRSPCFLRDLDAGTMGGDFDALDDAESLIVFEDVPRLSDERSDRFSELLNSLLEHGNEIIVSCQPSGDMYADAHRDRLLLNSDDLVLSDEESNYTSKLNADSPKRFFDYAERIACLRWSTYGGKELLEGIKREELPDDWKLALTFMLIVNSGTFGELCAVLEESRARVAWDGLARAYGFLGIQNGDDTFFTSVIDVRVIAQALSTSFPRIAQVSRQETPEALVAAFADILLGHDAPARAVTVMTKMGTIAGASEWIRVRGPELLESNQHVVICEVYDAMARGRKQVDSGVLVAAAWSFAAIYEPEQSLGLLRRLDRRATDPLDSMGMLALGAVLGENADDAAGRLTDALARHHAISEARSLAGGDTHAGEGPSPGIVRLADFLIGYLEDPDAALSQALVAERLDAGMSDMDRAVAAMAVMRDLLNREATDLSAEAMAYMRACKDLVARSLAAEEPRWFIVRAAEMLEECAEVFEAAELRADARSRTAMLAGKATLLSFREIYANNARRRENEVKDYRRTHPDLFRKTAKSEKVPLQIASIPILYVGMFGGMKVRKGAEAIDQSLLARRKARQLLAILILKHGHEIPRSRLSALLWPDSDEACGRKNLYAAWNNLRKLLSVDSSCPYLISDQEVCRIDMSLVTTDLDDFESLCRMLLLGEDACMDWDGVLEAITERFGEDILPSQRGDIVIDEARERYRTNLVDALIAASGRQIDGGNCQVALWLAREAHRRSRRREDVFAAKMRAEIANGLREDAMDTFFNCRKYLTEELGIDPSARLVELYQSVLEEEIVV